MKSSQIRHDTKAWKAQVWFSFGAAITVCASGLAWLPGARLLPKLVLLLSAASLLTLPAAAHANPNASAGSSALSLLPIAVSVVAPVAIFSAGVSLTVVSVQASAGGTVWVLERASDGSQASVRLAGASVMAVGSVLVCTVIASGVVLSAAGQVVAFVPNAVGEALLYNERITQ